MKQTRVRPALVSRETWRQQLTSVSRAYCVFDDYAETLLTWNRRVNLVSREMTLEEFEKHIRHSLMVSVSTVFQEAVRIVDIGTGGGLPGIPLAIAFPDKRFRLVDVSEKKCLVLKEIARSLHLRNVEVICEDIRSIRVDEDEVVISKHAFKLSDMQTSLSGQPWRHALILKGADYAAELELVSEPWLVEVLQLSGLEADRFYVEKVLLQIDRLPNG